MCFLLKSRVASFSSCSPNVITEPAIKYVMMQFAMQYAYVLPSTSGGADAVMVDGVAVGCNLVDDAGGTNLEMTTSDDAADPSLLKTV